MASKNVKTALAAYDAFNARDLDKAVSAYAENVPWEDHGRGITTKTRAEFKDSLQEWIDGFSDGKITDVEAIDAGDTVIVQYVGRGTNDGAMGPAPATGKRASLPGVDIVTRPPACVPGAPGRAPLAPLAKGFGPRRACSRQ